MNVSLSEQDGYAVAVLQGTIDESAKAAFDDHLHEIIEKPGNGLLVDLSGSDRITSAGMGHLVTLVSRANAKGSQVVLVRPSNFVSSILGATKLTKFFDVESTLEEGIARLRE